MAPVVTGNRDHLREEKNGLRRPNPFLLVLDKRERARERERVYLLRDCIEIFSRKFMKTSNESASREFTSNETAKKRVETLLATRRH
jgi:hypothetical protein